MPLNKETNQNYTKTRIKPETWALPRSRNKFNLIQFFLLYEPVISNQTTKQPKPNKNPDFFNISHFLASVLSMMLNCM